MTNRTKIKGDGLKDWGFIFFQGEGSDSTVFLSPNLKTRIAGVGSIDKAIKVAKAWADDGVQMIELCGWFRQGGRETSIIEAVGETVAVGYVLPAPESAHLMKKIFGSN
jgi:hypothetical protein